MTSYKQKIKINKLLIDFKFFTFLNNLRIKNTKFQITTLSLYTQPYRSIISTDNLNQILFVLYYNQNILADTDKCLLDYS